MAITYGTIDPAFWFASLRNSWSDLEQAARAKNELTGAKNSVILTSMIRSEAR